MQISLHFTKGGHLTKSLGIILFDVNRNDIIQTDCWQNLG